MNAIRTHACLLAILSLLTVRTGLAGQQQPPENKKEPAAEPDRAALEEEFSEKLSGSALVGTYSIVGRNGDRPPRAERYELESVTKLRDDYWVFVAHIKYGETDVKLPITLKVLWAGDTPVLSLTDLTIPGLGTFTARVMFYGDRYVGTWQHGKVGGHMWGTIEKPAAEESKDEPKDEQPNKP